MCVQDSVPHQVDPQKLKQLKFMADPVVAALEARKVAREFPRRGAESTE